MSYEYRQRLAARHGQVSPPAPPAAPVQIAAPPRQPVAPAAVPPEVDTPRVRRASPRLARQSRGVDTSTLQATIPAAPGRVLPTATAPVANPAPTADDDGENMGDILHRIQSIPAAPVTPSRPDISFPEA